MAYAVEVGAELAAYQPQDTVRVMIDPAGHRFCLYLDTDEPAQRAADGSPGTPHRPV